VSLDCEHSVTLNRQQCQNAGRIGSGIDINPVRSNFGFGHGGMAVHNEFAEILFTLKELIPDQKKSPQEKLDLKLLKKRRWSFGMH